MTKIVINIDKARDIHLDNLRTARESALKRLDVEFMRALEKGESTNDITRQKQELRDITKSPDLINATTLDEIKAVWHPALDKIN